MIKRFVRLHKKNHDLKQGSGCSPAPRMNSPQGTGCNYFASVFQRASLASSHQLIFFIHIPKTAGTSFRKAAEEYFGVNSVCYDYAINSIETSGSIIESIYKQKDYLGLQVALVEAGTQFLSGHVPANKYVHLLGAHQSITFLRDPVQRIISEYNHFVRHNDYEGDLPSFYRKPQFINRQFKMLQGIPLESLGFIGLTEDYEVSLAQLNAVYGVSIQSKALNQGREATDQAYQLPAEQLQEMQQLNSQDIALYQRTVELYQQRHTLFVQDLPYVHGAIQQINPKSIRGWAWYAQGDQPVTVEVLVEGQKVAALVANDLRTNLLYLSPPRQGYIGFQYNFSKPLGVGVKVAVRVAETDQLLGQQKVVVA